MSFRNLAGTADTTTAAGELALARIPIVTGQMYGECKIHVRGSLGGWEFTRAWRYWSANHSDGVPVADVEAFDKEWGREARAHGFAGGGALHRMGSVVTTFHIDDQIALEAFRRVICQPAADRESRNKGDS